MLAAPHTQLPANMPVEALEDGSSARVPATDMEEIVAPGICLDSGIWGEPWTEANSVCLLLQLQL